MNRGIYSRFAFLDTNILSELAKDRTTWQGAVAYLLREDLALAVGSQVAELVDVDRLHHSLAALLISVPAGIIKTWDAVMAEEVSAHPEWRTDRMLTYPLNALLIESDGVQQLTAFLGSERLNTIRREQRAAAAQFLSRVVALKSSFPPAGPAGRYTTKQAEDFADLLVLQVLSKQQPGFFARFAPHLDRLKPRTFASIRLLALVLFYKYYLNNRPPTEESEFADLSHLYAIPYCEVVVVERGLAGILRQIKRNHDVLSSVAIHDISFMRSWRDSGAS